MPGPMAGLGRRGPAGRKRQATQYLQSLVSGKGGKEGERVGGFFFPLFFCPTPTRGKGFLSPGMCRGAHGALCWRVREDAAKQQGGQGCGVRSKKDRFSGLRWVKDYRKAVPSPCNPPTALPLPLSLPSPGAGQQGKEGSTQDPTPVSSRA